MIQKTTQINEISVTFAQPLKKDLDRFEKGLEKSLLKVTPKVKRFF